MVRNYLDNSESHRGDLGALYSDKLDQRLGSLRMYAFILFFIVSGYIAVAFNISYVGLVCLFFFYIVRGFATPILKGYINQITFSEMRATVLSIRNFVIRLMFAAMAPLVGWLHDLYSLSIALQATAAHHFCTWITILDPAISLQTERNFFIK